MNSAIGFDLGWFIIHIKGSQVRMSKLKSTTVFVFFKSKQTVFCSVSKRTAFCDISSESSLFAKVFF